MCADSGNLSAEEHEGQQTGSPEMITSPPRVSDRALSVGSHQGVVGVATARRREAVSATAGQRRVGVNVGEGVPASKHGVGLARRGWGGHGGIGLGRSSV